MITLANLELELRKMDAVLEAFERTYLRLIDIGEDEREDRNRGVMAFYVIRDMNSNLIRSVEELNEYTESAEMR